MNTLALVMKQTSFNMQLTFRQTNAETLNEYHYGELKKTTVQKMQESYQKREEQLRKEESSLRKPKCLEQLRYEARLRKKAEIEAKRVRESNEKLLNAKKKEVEDEIYGYLFNLDIQKNEDIESLAEVIQNYYEWCSFYDYSYDDSYNKDLNVVVDDLDLGECGQFESIRLMIPFEGYSREIEMFIDVKRLKGAAYKMRLYWNNWGGKACEEDGKMKGNFKAHIYNWANDLFNELIKLHKTETLSRRS